MDRFESDRRVIERHVHERLRLVKSYRRGAANRKHCDALNYRISVAKACLLSPSLKTVYDRQLREKAPDAAAKSTAPTDGQAAAALPMAARVEAPAAASPAKQPDDLAFSVDDDLGFAEGPISPADPRASAADVVAKQPAAKPSPEIQRLDELDLVLDGNLDLSLFDASDTVVGLEASSPTVPAPSPAAAKSKAAAKPKAATKQKPGKEKRPRETCDRPRRDRREAVRGLVGECRSHPGPPPQAARRCRGLLDAGGRSRRVRLGVARPGF